MPVLAPRLALPLLTCLFLASLLPLGAGPGHAQTTTPTVELRPERILPEGIDYDPQIPTPASVLGFEVGERHVRHDQLVAYMRRLAEASPRVTLTEQGRTHEKRPLLYLTISSPANLARVDDLRQQHRELSEPDSPVTPVPDLSGQPVVVWLGYSIHGNEASGANASLLVAYHFAAARDPETARLLDDAVILLDPSLNPDGLGRFAQWANMYRGERAVADPNHREHREGWPNGRTNHYWFDLNRDWLLLQHPESRARVATLQSWRPNVVADFHEMGSDGTYFFQPGVPSRKNPLTPDENVTLTQAIARHHAKALDALGRLYYTEETFDDFYYGKGSTYPDVQGSVGILFEQASARGHRQETVHGVLDFRFAISNQFTTSLSTVAGAVESREALLGYQARFYRDALAEARRSSTAAFLFGTADDPARTYRLAEILLAHGIELRELSEPVEIDGRRFEPGHAYAVPLEQRQHRLARALFETLTTFEDTTFYDVSTWTLPLAFGFSRATLDKRRADALGDVVADLEPPRGTLEAGDNPVAWAFEWSGYYAPRVLARILEAGGTARVATRPFEADTAVGRKSFGYGTVVVQATHQGVSPDALREVMETAAREDGVDLHALSSGLTPGGIDLGSPSLRPVTLPKTLLVIGEGVSTYRAGEMWHLLDHRFGMEVTLVPRDDLGGVDLDRYSHVILVDGDFRPWGDEVKEALDRWLRRGGTLVATERAAGWVEREILGRERGEAEPATPGANGERPLRAAYADYDRDRGAQLVSGSIFQVELDLTHPLAYGYRSEKLPVFRTSTHLLAPSGDPYENVALYSPSPLLSGYASEENIERVRGTAAVLTHRHGGGVVVLLADNPTFRGYWYGTQKLVLNSLFFAPVIQRTSPPETWFE